MSWATINQVGECKNINFDGTLSLFIIPKSTYVCIHPLLLCKISLCHQRMSYSIINFDHLIQLKMSKELKWIKLMHDFWWNNPI